MVLLSEKVSSLPIPQVRNRIENGTEKVSSRGDLRLPPPEDRFTIHLQHNDSPPMDARALDKVADGLHAVPAAPVDYRRQIRIASIQIVCVFVGRIPV